SRPTCTRPARSSGCRPPRDLDPFAPELDTVVADARHQRLPAIGGGVRKEGGHGPCNPDAHHGVKSPRTSYPPSPASRARATASAREVTWIFVKMLETWLRTVFSLTTN